MDYNMHVGGGGISVELCAYVDADELRGRPVEC